mmetsp:Transcript_13664/g.18734  ORF Transcript_13664/g.18734 Transcript_13664/m.18734 type:complete len:141 (-) Transcript_13664:142-564(-)|eukprot:CAMPEP_0196583972 /NCGR_PEP_ID=MMETSP1081-20130531/45352_1 /TAXON_ID=36882 /ORGANISM="Pyramimonas amylifera, Strain CCMP720" /LENGTH=140 /DNA_ID=CAMNT_0041905019 /DNA_START=97 /DNA_END=519 /DNA_ORIENTATION=+
MACSMTTFAPSKALVSNSRTSALSGSRVVPRAAPKVSKQAKQFAVCAAETESSTSTGMTIEEQRVIAKDLVVYFNERKYQKEYTASRVFGWTQNAEVTNGRWVMFGILVGLMTEYANDITFVDQILLTITNLGFADVYEG